MLQGPHFRIDVHSEALDGVATAMALMRVAMLGTRGVPASYSGFETCAEELGARLAARGHDVTVYCRVPHITHEGTSYRGMRLVKLPTIRSKHLDTITHSLLSAVHALSQGYDVSLFFNVGTSAVTWIPRLAGQRVVLNVDGLDWKRKKWGRVRAVVSSTPRSAGPHAFRTGSSPTPGGFRQYYLARYGAPSPTYIAYGAEPMTVPPGPLSGTLRARARPVRRSSWAGWCPRTAPITSSRPFAGSPRTSGA